MKKKMTISRIVSVLLITVLVLSVLSGCSKSNRATKETEDMTLGIDVAKYQGTIDWQQVAQSGVDFAMVRIGYRGMSDGEIKADSNGRYNLQEASRAGVKLGVYFFSTAITEEEAVEEAAWVADQIGGYPITYPVVYDCENFTDPESRQFSLSKKERTDIAIAFLKTIEKLGYEGMFYASKNDMENSKEWDMRRIADDYKIWVAQYPAEPYPETRESSYSGEHQMWQYSMEGNVAGIEQPVDLNIAYFGYNGIEPPRSNQIPEEVGPDVEAMMDFTDVSEQVTAKEETNLRSVPSQDTDSVVLRKLKNGEVAQRIAISSSGWSKLLLEGNTYYAVSSYLTTDLKYGYETDIVIPAEANEDDIETKFNKRNQIVTAKEVVNLRSLPSVEHEEVEVIAQLKNGETATCIGVSDNGWSKLIYRNTVCYAVSSYLTPVDGDAAEETFAPEAEQPEEGGIEIETEFEPINDQVTAKVEVNLRNLPSTEHPNVKVVARLYNGQVATRTGINRDLGWSRVEFNGMTLYCVSSYLKEVE